MFKNPFACLSLNKGKEVSCLTAKIVSLIDEEDYEER